MRRALAALAAVVMATAACSSSTATEGGSGKLGGSIRVDAASSLTEAFDALKTRFEHARPGTKIDISYGASSDLSTQIAEGAPVDVFASASEQNMQALGGAALHPTDFVSNTLEIAIPPGNPGHVSSLADLAKPGVKVAVCDPAVPCGAVAAEVFKNAGLTVHPKASLADVKSTLAAVESGEVDAGLVYVTDVRAAGKDAKGIEIPRAVNASTTYPIAVLKRSRNPDLARAFVDYVLSDAGRQLLLAAGFEEP